MLDRLNQDTHLFVTVEEHAVMAGAGSSVSEYFAQSQIVKPIIHLGLDDSFMPQATHAQMLAAAGLDSAGITKSTQAAWLKLKQAVSS